MHSKPTINCEICRMLAVIGGVLALLLLAGWVMHWQSNGQVLMESDGWDAHVVGRDFVNFWMMGKAAWLDNPGTLYGLQHYNDTLRAFIGDGDYLVQAMSYPPTLLAPLAPFGLLPYGLALILFSALGVVSVVIAARKTGWTRETILLLLLSPAALVGFASGQLAFFLTAAFLAGWAQMDKRSWLAGLLFGLLSLKPQFVLLLPLMLLASRRWKVLLAATITTLALLALTTALYGMQVWQQFIELNLPVQHHILTQPAKNIRAWMPTIYMDLRTARYSDGAAMIGQLFAGAGAAAMVIWCFMRRRDAHWSLLLFTSACLLASPYIMGYDTLTFTASMLILLRTTQWPTKAWVVAFLYFLPLVHFIAVAFEIPGTALLPLVAVILSYKQLKAV